MNRICVQYKFLNLKDLEIVEKDIPEPGAHQVRIKVQACGICHSDAVTKEGLLLPGMTLPEYPRVPGHFIAAREISYIYD